MNTCRTCKHCKEDMGDFICTMIDGDSAVAWLEGSNYDSDLLYMNPDKFGCILHEPATPEPEQI